MVSVVTPLSPGGSGPVSVCFRDLKPAERKDKLRDLLAEADLWYNIPVAMRSANIPASLVFNLGGDFCVKCLVPAHTCRQGRWRFIHCVGEGCETSCHAGCVAVPDGVSSFRCDSCTESLDSAGSIIEA